MSARSDAARVVRFWLAVEMFTPQRLQNGDALENVVDVQPGEPMPWEAGSPLSSAPIRADQTWRHEVFGGLYELRSVSDALVRLWGDDSEGDQRERAHGQSALFACIVDSDGLLVEGSAVLSGCASAVGRALGRGRSPETWLAGFGEDALHYGDELGKLAGSKGAAGGRLLAASVRAAVPVAGPGDAGADAAASGGVHAAETTGAPEQSAVRLDLHPLTGADLARFTDKLASRLGVVEELAPRGIRVRSYRVSARYVGDAVEPPFLNSLFTGELARVGGSVARGDLGAGLAAYLTSSRRLATAERIDVRREPLAVRACNAPEHLPLGRWVTNTDRVLAFSQQFAVNEIMEQLADGEGLFAVNGPPGTGKTTMLRDLVAAVVVERALRLAELKTPGEAFDSTQKHTWQTERMRRTIVPPHPALTGFEIVVASSNNDAVENVTTEIPGPGGIGTQWLDAARDLDYFAATAKLTCGDGAWAMVAAKLGNRANRDEMIQTFWWGHEKAGVGAPSSLPRAAQAARDQGGAQAGSDGMMHVLKRLETADVDWPAAVAGFRGAVDKVRALSADRQAAASVIERLPVIQRECERLQAALATTEEEYAGLIAQQPGITQLMRTADAQWRIVRDQRETHDRLKPGLIVSLSTRFRAGREWYTAYRELHGKYLEATRELDDARRGAQDLLNRIAASRAAARRAQSQLAEAVRERETLRRRGREARERWGAHVPDGPEYAETSRIELIEQREKSAPWADQEFAAARTELFVAAVRLHKAFITAEASVIRWNLSALMDILDRGKGRPRAPAVLAAWQTLFLVVPVVSSTFASFGKLFAGLGRESLGWLLIDEAGQAAPQEAVGAIWRARRTVVVGDPMQLEPIVGLPWGGQLSLLNEMKVDQSWAPSRTSVQGVADRLARYGTLLPAATLDGSEQEWVWVGTPLRVHRRCDQQIFDICNRIAYDGLMVYGTVSPDGFHGRNAWYDIRAAHTQGHWVPAEGEALRKILASLKRAGVPAEAIRVLSPFRQVAARAKNEYREVFPDTEVSREKRSKWVGTVHKMQGKEADVVILVLGTHPHRTGARGWAAERPNLLNVAVSRARRRIYVIGNRAAWGDLNYFKALAASLDGWPPRETD